MILSQLHYKHLDHTTAAARPILSQSNPAYQLSPPAANDNLFRPPIYEQFDNNTDSDYEKMAN